MIDHGPGFNGIGMKPRGPSSNGCCGLEVLGEKRIVMLGVIQQPESWELGVGRGGTWEIWDVGVSWQPQ